MNWCVIAAELLAFSALFTALVFAGIRKKESAAGIHNYPPDIQAEYFKTHEKQDVSAKSQKVILAKCTGLMLFCTIIVICALLAGAKGFGSGFLFGFGMMAWIGAYDTFFLDWVLFANMKCFRLPGTEHMDKAYHQKWFHLKGALFPGLAFAVIVGLCVGGIVQLVCG